MASSIFAENRTALRELADSEQRYRNVVEAQTEYIIRVAPDGRMSSPMTPIAALSARHAKSC